MIDLQPLQPHPLQERPHHHLREDAHDMHLDAADRIADLQTLDGELSLFRLDRAARDLHLGRGGLLDGGDRIGAEVVGDEIGAQKRDRAARDDGGGQSDCDEDSARH